MRTASRKKEEEGWTHSDSARPCSGSPGRQAAVDLDGAAKDMMNAHQMMAQANDFDTQAGKMQLQAQARGRGIAGNPIAVGVKRVFWECAWTCGDFGTRSRLP